MKIDNNDSIIEELEQYDYLSDNFEEKFISKYYPLVGLFTFKFSYLEHSLNMVIADYISDREHESGYLILQSLYFRNKIELFNRIFIRLSKFNRRKTFKEKIKSLNSRLEKLNKFRNSIAHANWCSLDESGFVRTKIILDEEDASIKFKKVKMDLITIRKNIKEIDALINKLYTVNEQAYQFFK